MATRADLAQQKTLRRDLWWVESLPIVVWTLIIVTYSTWAALENRNYFSEPYLSPLYSPCLAVSCEHALVKLVGNWFAISPALLILWVPMGFRVSCYYFRGCYYRAFLGSPPACAVRDVPRRYSGERRFPFVLQNLHRYFFWLAVGYVAIHWWDAAISFRFHDGWGMGLGSLVILIDAALITSYVFSCHSSRHIVGGGVDVFSKNPIRYKLWSAVSKANEHHGKLFWASLTWIVVADLYVRMLANGVFTDPRLF